ncbi:DNA mismatch endonuclease Vsr [Acetobacter sp. LMG 1636]|uniref:Very short patch repair endonuclease n=1 Tax=Acetobacter fallax TaxID=1737473 RepID=A0ABX0K413_9PROT|nr:DNA mismatch endonuclease Vsr [Acetobacter fallax]NHO34623.1 DNA mismatch endonuclease Vsr [Acetobacter fallax]
MVDVHDPATRSRNMAAIRGSHTKPEIMIRKTLHAAGFRFRLHVRDLPGKPDLVFPKYQAVIFVNGCFWHHHDCHLFKWPATRDAFWREKIGRNVENDAMSVTRLQAMGWRVATVWECALRGKNRLAPTVVTERLTAWLKSDNETLTVRGE